MNINPQSLISLLHFFWLPLCASLIMSLICGYIGCFIVLRKLSFLTDTLAHSSLLGLGIGFIIGITPQLTLIPFSIGLSVALIWFSKRNKDDLASLTAVAFSLCMGAGIIILDRYGRGGQEIVHILFGDVLWMNKNDLLELILLGAPILAFLFWATKRLALIFLSPELAAAAGLNAGLYEHLFMICVGAVIAVCIKLVGVLLVTSLITVPPLLANSAARSFRQQLILSPALGVLCTGIGMFLAIAKDLPPGPCVATVAGLVFVFSNATSSLLRRA